MDDNPLDRSVGFQFEVPSDDEDLYWDWRSTIAGMLRKDLDARGNKVRDVSFVVLTRAGPYPREAQVHVDLEAVATKELREAVWATMPARASDIVFSRVRLAHLAAYDEFLKVQKELEEANSAATTALATAQKAGEGVKSAADLFESVEKLVAAGGKILALARLIGAL